MYKFQIIISAILAFFSLMVVKHPNILFNVFSLILVFIFSSVLLLTFSLEYNALIFISIYVGAIAILFIFVIMMLNISSGYTLSISNFYKFFIFILIFIFYFFLEDFCANIFLNFLYFVQIDSLNIINVFSIVSFTVYFIPFYLCGVILFIALFGAVYNLMDNQISLVSESQDIYQQVSTFYSYYKKL